MRLSWLILLLPLALAGCFSFSSSNPSPPRHDTTVIVPQGTRPVCANGTAPPCN